jgi:hypothetical protein
MGAAVGGHYLAPLKSKGADEVRTTSEPAAGKDPPGKELHHWI